MERKMKRVIVYYSLTNNTKEAAEHLAGKLDADLYQIETLKPMPKGKGMQMMLGGMKATFGMHPAIKGVPDELTEYAEIVLGTPIWAGKNAPAVNTLLKSKEVREKITAVFTFSGGGDNDKCMAGLQKKLPNLKHTVALADRNNKLASENERKLDTFAEELLNGKR